MKLSAPLVIVLLVIVAVAGLGVGFFAGGSGAAYQTTTTTQPATNQVGYWTQAFASKPWTYYQLSRTQLVPLLNAGNSSIFLMDVRQATGTAGYASGHIAGAINIPFQNVTAAVTAGTIPKNKIIIDVCYTGQTGAQTTAVLRTLGYTAYNLSGGMAAWNNATRASSSAPLAIGENYPIVTGASPGSWTVFNP